MSNTDPAIEGGADAASAGLASAKRVLSHQRPLSLCVDEAALLYAWLRAVFGIDCPAEVGPIPKLGGHTCRCNRARPHRLPHTCDCGSWFEPRIEESA